MTPWLYVAICTIGYSLILAWGFRTLPAERWQIAAAVPLTKNRDGQWTGRNLTYYGVFTAFAYVTAVAQLLVLMGSIGVAPVETLCVVVLVLLCCVPASRWVARWIEGKQHTFTVAGAFFVGILVTPAMVGVVNQAARSGSAFRVIPILPMLAAAAICYTLGEGLGRLACLSFGCCYGRRLIDCPAWIQRVLAQHGMIFSGRTKKAAYEAGYEGIPLVPVQALSATILTFTGLLGVGLFLAGYYRVALALALVSSQLWRVAAEFLRADYRGELHYSPYQFMALGGAAYGVAAAWVLESAPPLEADVVAGLRHLWSPAVILFLQGLWLATFLFTGRSEVTEARVSIHVCQERV